MEKDVRRPGAYPIDETPLYLPSTFSPWGNRKDFLINDEPGVTSPVAESPLQSPEMSSEKLSGPADVAEEYVPERPVAEEYVARDHDVRSQLPSRASPFIKPAAAGGIGRPEDQLMLRPLDHGYQPRTECVITAGDSSAALQEKRGALRRTRFKEMLSSSLSTAFLSRSNPSSPTHARYEAIREDPPAAPPYRQMERRDTDEWPLSSVSTVIPTPCEVVENPAGSDDNDDDVGIDDLAARYERPPLDCYSKRDVYVKHWSWDYVILVLLSLYSTLLSGLWFVVSIYQPRYGRGISSSEGWKMAPSTATLVCTLVAKTIELSFVTVYVALLGQVLTRRAFVKKAKGVTLAEMTMRNWVIQPGSLLTYWEGVPYAAMTILGCVSLLATISALFYTTASDAMVSPKLAYGPWESRQLEGLVKASYANPYYVQTACLTPIDKIMDPNASAPSCLDVQYSGQSYHNLLTFMGEWQAIHDNGTSTVDQLRGRPVGKHNLFDNTTMVSSWIETEFSDLQSNFAAYKRVVNNVTLAMPHAGVYSAATDARNDILQPDDLAGVGEYSIRASVSSPAINVMCVNMARNELAPLIYTTWPRARTISTIIPGQRIGEQDWFNDVPPPTENEWLNRTAVDDVFRWGPRYHRRPPVFQMFPIDYNMITNTSVYGSDSIYLLAKSGTIADYTLCQLRSWVTPKCSTRFDVSGISGGHMQAHCEDPSDPDSYAAASGNEDAHDVGYPTVDWKNMADEWRLSMDLNGGVQNNNASNARIMTHLILHKAALDPLLPSIGEALAVLASSTLVVGSLGSTYRVRWEYPQVSMDPGVYEPFKVTMRTQQYASTHISPWQAIFYAVLGTVFVINVACLLYLLFFRPGLVNDYTEPQNLFTLAVNSPPSTALSGSCGRGPDSSGMVVPWRVRYSSAANHYFFEEVGAKLNRPDTRHSVASGSDLLPAQEGRLRNSHYDNYKKLRESRAWL